MKTSDMGSTVPHERTVSAGIPPTDPIIQPSPSQFPSNESTLSIPSKPGRFHTLSHAKLRSHTLYCPSAASHDPFRKSVKSPVPVLRDVDQSPLPNQTLDSWSNTLRPQSDHTKSPMKHTKLNLFFKRIHVLKGSDSTSRPGWLRPEMYVERGPGRSALLNI